ncbi:MAG: Crp/Fnr family transcriptional regulator [Saprospiraceae bacterium]|nr:Crp/Fnr family transcriptional regulator [Saprospiraceae bacterium]MCF8248986.1 Crp/Fnr family transcriptional regulator [Saprospiraceae bacterium]MCF8279197.1 Crp/Fnr family transcriptional regulator [Bacteroidales bacterium]MCF8310880.1 Crp/Fnr family transcriptional regulator [Saprospiraceae bacterium]MCF8439532.1 Crp/Fnr family transcriptional regulator [Saprospiraceae bacterium]
MSATNGFCTVQDTSLKSCMSCLLRRHSLFSDLIAAELIALNKNRYEMSYHAGETIYKEGTQPPGLICLNQGKVKIFRQHASGAEQIVALKKPVDFIGFRALMGGLRYQTSAVALEDISVCIIDKNDFFKVIANNSQLAFKIIRQLAHELNETELRMANLTKKHLRARLADALLLVQDIYGSCPVKRTLNVPLKRADLAALANMTTANAIRVLYSFSKEDIVEIDQRNITIKDLKTLRDISVFGR